MSTEKIPAQLARDLLAAADGDFSFRQVPTMAGATADPVPGSRFEKALPTLASEIRQSAPQFRPNSGALLLSQNKAPGLLKNSTSGTSPNDQKLPNNPNVGEGVEELRDGFRFSVPGPQPRPKKIDI